MNRILLAGIIASVLGVGVSLGFRASYTLGVRETTAKFLAADKQGKETVRETAEKTLAGIGDDTDPDSLLAETDGLRD